MVVGLGLHHRLASIVDLERTAAPGIDVIARRAGGGALLLDRERVLCGAIALPTADVSLDVTESYRWLGDALVQALASVGVTARRTDVAEARADVAALHASIEPAARLLLNACYGALSPHEVVVDTPNGAAKLVGLAQVRRRERSLFQFGVLLRDQSPLAEFLRIDPEDDRAALRIALERRTIGLEALTSRSVAEVAEAIADATPSAP